MKLIPHIIGALTLLVMAGVFYASWLLAGRAKDEVFTVASPDDLFFQMLLTLPIFFFVGLLVGVVGTVLSLEAKGEKD